MLLAQIKANYSSGDDFSSGEETREDETEDSDDYNEVKQSNKCGTEENGDDFASESSDSACDGPKSSHRLLQHKLTLDEGTSGTAEAQNEGGKEKRKKKRRRKPASSDGESSDEAKTASDLDDMGMSDELSQSEDESNEGNLKSSKAKNQNKKIEVPCILLSDTSSENESDKEEEKEEEEDGEGNADSQGTPKGRKKIRKIMEDGNLRAETQEALREEEERCKRLADREQQLEDRREVIIIETCSITTKLILDQDEVTKEPLVQVHKNLVTTLKPHQVDGVQFIWDSCCESVKKANSSPGSGCILAHCMGLGKTLQVVTFLHTVLLSSNLKFRTALVVCPLNTLLNWVSEFKKWQRSMGKDTVKVLEVARLKDHSERLVALQGWQRDGGVVIMGYEMYRNLALCQKITNERWKAEFKRVLVDPGPDFVVCDEGHILRNDTSNISKAMNAIKTQRRVVLTGTPLQNNLVEYHCMVNFIKRNLVGSLKEFRNRFINPIQNGQCADSTAKDVRVMKRRAHVLHAMLAGCVQRRDYSALTKFLPLKYEYVLAVRVSPLQYKLYNYYLNHFTGGGRMMNMEKMKTRANLFKDFQVLSRVWTHPWCLQLSYDSKTNKRNREKKNQPVLALLRKAARIEGTPGNSAVVGAAVGGILDAQGTDDDSWYKSMLSAEDAFIMEHSGKMVLLFEILKMAEELNDKVLVFSQSLISLNLIETFLKASHRARDPSSFKAGSWIKNIDYYRLDGSTNVTNRKTWAARFNDTSNTRGRLFLISTRAGSLGINLVAANRVIIFDASWNPSYDVQSIYRVYRFGQLKQVFVYRFLAQGTMEEKIYDRQVTKQSLSNRVVDQQQIERHFTLIELTELYTFEPDLLNDPNSKKSKRQTSAAPKDKVLAQLLEKCKDQIVSYHEHESLLDHIQEEELSEAERKDAWAEYEAESNTSNLSANILQGTLEKKSNVELLDLLNNCRKTMSEAFTSVQSIKTHTIEEYVLRAWHQYPNLPEDHIRTKADIWRLSDEKEHERRRAAYQDILAQQRSLIYSIQEILSSRRNQAQQQANVILHRPTT